MTRSPKPWNVVIGGPKRSANAPRVVDRRGDPVVAFGNQLRHYGFARVRSNADFIVRACNAHDDLLAACELALEAICAGLEDWMVMDVEVAARAAIARVKGEK